MNQNVPIPTDNVYKFYAMFGLVVMLTTAIMFFIRHEEYNRRAFERHIPMKLLKSKEDLDDQQTHELYLYEQKAGIDESNKKFELSLYMFLFFCLARCSLHTDFSCGIPKFNQRKTS